MNKIPCACYDVNHNLTRAERQSLHTELQKACTANNTLHAASIRGQLSPCPTKWKG